MRVTFVLRTLDRTGGNRMVAMHAAALRARGHAVEVVAAWDPPVAPRLSRWLAALRRPATARPPAPAPSHLDTYGIVPRMTTLPGRLLPQDLPDADVVVATWWETAEWVQSLPPAKGARAYFVQHYEAFDYMPRQRVDATYRAPLHRIAVAPWLVRKLCDEFGDARVDLVPNAVDPTRFDAPPRGRRSRPTVGFVWSPTPFKGADVALRALRRLRAEVPDLRVIAFGAADLHAAVPGCGWIEHAVSPPEARIRELYTSADVWISTSRSEGFNLPALEAMACRTPLVSTRTGWPADAVVDGVNGHLCEIDDADAVAERTLRVLQADAAHWACMSEQAHRTAHALHWDEASRLFEQALVTAIERQAPAAVVPAWRPAARPGGAPLTPPPQLR